MESDGLREAPTNDQFFLLKRLQLVRKGARAHAAKRIFELAESARTLEEVTDNKERTRVAK